MRVKICGLNPIRDVQLCIDQKVDFLGFVFYKKSPRNISLTDPGEFPLDIMIFNNIMKCQNQIFLSFIYRILIWN